MGMWVAQSATASLGEGEAGAEEAEGEAGSVAAATST